MALLSALLVAALQAPDGFREVPSPRANKARLSAANLSDREWIVWELDGRLNVTDKAKSIRRRDQPFKKATVKLANARATATEIDATKVADGWIQGFDAGEFGGGIFWFSPNWKVQKKISDLNCHRIYEMYGKFFAVTGLNHLGLRRGAILVLDHLGKDAWEAKKVADVGADPSTYTLEGPDRLLLCCETGIFRFSARDKLERLHDGVPGLLYPNSMALGKDKSVWIGMRNYIVQLVPKKGGYDEHWFEPKNISHPHR